jgi:hypothetical protein
LNSRKCGGKKDGALVRFRAGQRADKCLKIMKKREDKQNKIVGEKARSTGKKRSGASFSHNFRNFKEGWKLGDKKWDFYNFVSDFSIEKLSSICYDRLTVGGK